MSANHSNTGTDRLSRNGGRGRDPTEDPVKPDSPVKLTKPSWKYIARKTLREFSDDQCTDLAAALTYYAVLALFPALLALVSLLGLFGQTGQDRGTYRGAVRDGRRVGRRHHLQGTITGIDGELLRRVGPGHRHRRGVVVRVRVCGVRSAGR